MATSQDIDDHLRSFFAGRVPFNKLADTLRGFARRPADATIVDERIREFVNLGRLPQDLGDILLREVFGDAGPPAAEDQIDPPTRPAVRATRRAADVPAMIDPGAVRDPFRDKVDEVVLSAFINDFKPYRARGEAKPAQASKEDKDLDRALADFRGARLRRDAQNARDGRARGFDLGAMRPQQATLGVGAMLKERFVLDGEIGRGGMGVVYRAVDRRRLEAMHGQPYVAIKVLNGDFRNHPDALRALEAEARKAQELAHPNIVTVYDFDRDGAQVYLVMELLEGRPLDKVIAATPSSGFGYDTFRTIIDGLCRGLGHAHSRGVVHADLKPGNVFVLDSGMVKLLDFGIASAGRTGGFDGASLNALTLAYASPEMVDGLPRDPTDDVYALGCLTYLLLTGRHPFERRPAKEAQAMGLRVERPPGLTGAAWRTLKSALAFERSARPANATVFAAGLAKRSLMDRLRGRRLQAEPSLIP